MKLDSTEVHLLCVFLRQMKLLNLTTRFGDLDLSFEPSGTDGYEDGSPRSVRYDLGDGLLAGDKRRRPGR
jgi:hypothetical protein